MTKAYRGPLPSTSKRLLALNAQSSLTRRDILIATSATLASAGLPAAMTEPAIAGTKPTEPPAEIMALINTVFDSFNRKDAAVFNSVFGGDVVIVDGFAPFRWIGPGAAARWWADAETWAKAGGVAKEHLFFEGIRSLGGKWHPRIRCAFRDTYDHAEWRKVDSPTRYTHVHPRKAGRCLEG